MVTTLPPDASPDASPELDPVAGVSPNVDRLRLVLVRLARRIRTNSVEAITPSQLAVLATVNRNGPMTVGQIAEAEHVKPPSVSKIVSALERAGLVERRTDATDRRCSHIAVAPGGYAYIDEVRSAGRTWLQSRFAAIDPADADQITAALPALERLLGDLE